MVCFTYILHSVNVRSLVCKLCHCVDLLIHVVCTYDFVSVIGMHARSVFFYLNSKLVLLFALVDTLSTNIFREFQEATFFIINFTYLKFKMAME